jgi:hypothetical protein
MRMRVPMRSTGADHPVVAKKTANAVGAKGVSYSARFRDQPFTLGGIFGEGKVV